MSFCLLAPSAAAQTPYLSAEAGFAYWPDTSNSNELEAVHRANRVHGLNSGGVNLSGDGNTLHATGLMFNVWPGVEVAERVEIYGAEGLARRGSPTLGDEGLGFTWQARSGVVARVGERFELDPGYRYYRVEDGELLGSIVAICRQIASLTDLTLVVVHKVAASPACACHLIGAGNSEARLPCYLPICICSILLPPGCCGSWC